MSESTSPLPLPEKAPLAQKVTIRPAQPSDAQAIAHLGATVFTTSFGYSLPPSDLKAYLESYYSRSSILTSLTDPKITTLVALSPLSPYPIIGFAQLNRSSTEECIETSPKPVELQRLYVDTNFHGGGMGRLLFDGMEGIAREEGYGTLWLGVWEENFKAQRFYERFGLVKCGWHDFTMGECVQRDFILKKDLWGIEAFCL